MKKLTTKSGSLKSVVLVAIFLSGVGYSLMAQNYDDVLYTPQKKKTTTSQEPQRYIDSTIHNQSTESTETLNNSYQNIQSPEVDAQGNTYVTNNYNGSYTNYSEDDYYDYAYAARIKRFYSPSNVAWNYYDPYYTNLYWYDYNPASWGVSIYLGYSWWYPSYYYSPYSYGWGYSYPYYGGYWGGYYRGYWDGYYAGSYYNSWDRYSCYYGNPYTYSYGPRTSVGRATTGYDRYSTSRTSYGRRGMDYSATRNSRSNVGISRDSRTFGERYESRNPNARTATNARGMSATSSRSANTSLDSRSTRTYNTPATTAPSRRNGVDIDRSSSSRATYSGASTRGSDGNANAVRTETYRKPVENVSTRMSTPVSSETSQRSTNSNTTRQSTSTTQPRTNSYQSTPSRNGNSTPSVNPSRNSGSSTPSRTVSPSTTPSRSGSTVSPNRSSSSSPSTGTSRSSGGSSTGGSRSSGGRR